MREYIELIMKRIKGWKLFEAIKRTPEERLAAKKFKEVLKRENAIKNDVVGQKNTEVLQAFAKTPWGNAVWDLLTPINHFVSNKKYTELENSKGLLIGVPGFDDPEDNISKAVIKWSPDNETFFIGFQGVSGKYEYSITEPDIRGVMIRIWEGIIYACNPPNMALPYSDYYKWLKKNIGRDKLEKMTRFPQLSKIHSQYLSQFPTLFDVRNLTEFYNKKSDLFSELIDVLLNGTLYVGKRISDGSFNITLMINPEDNPINIIWKNLFSPRAKYQIHLFTASTPGVKQKLGFNQIELLIGAETKGDFLKKASQEIVPYMKYVSDSETMLKFINGLLNLDEEAVLEVLLKLITESDRLMEIASELKRECPEIWSRLNLEDKDSLAQAGDWGLF
jgi:hypothetical protein